MMKFALVLAIFPLLAARAELPPSVYESMQQKAGEALQIEILRVDVSPGDDPSSQRIHLVAMANDVIRSASGVKPSDVINIIYTVTERPKGWVGPGAIPILNERDKTIAYLNRAEDGDFNPAAGRMTFENF